jgi:hypothetical protein
MTLLTGEAIQVATDGAITFLENKAGVSVGLLCDLEFTHERDGIHLRAGSLWTLHWPIEGLNIVVRRDPLSIPLVEYLNCYSESGELSPNVYPGGFFTVHNIKLRAYGARYRMGEEEL